MSIGIGLTSGPLIGSILYEFGGFKAPFLTYGTVFLVIGVFTMKILPVEIDKEVVKVGSESNSPEEIVCINVDEDDLSQRGSSKQLIIELKNTANFNSSSDFKESTDTSAIN